MSKRNRRAVQHPTSAAGLNFAAILLLSGCGLGTPALRGTDGNLQVCSGPPRCVTSLPNEDADHKVEPIRYAGARDDARQAMLRVLALTPRVEVVTEQPDYVHAEFTTPLSRYVDDVEFVFPESQPLIQVRSSSRIGYYDFGANRDRVERLRSAFHLLVPMAAP